MSKRSTKGTPSGIILPRSGETVRIDVPVRTEGGKDVGSDERNPSDDLKGTENDPRAGDLVRKDCPGCGEREAGPYCIEVDPGIMWPVPGSALNPQGPMRIVEKYHVPVWLCKPCFQLFYDRACNMVHEMVKHVGPKEKVGAKS